MVRYTVKAERAKENARLIEEVFGALQRASPGGLRYASYRLDDGVTFVHVASVDDPNANPLQALESFKTFTAGVRDRCDVLPVTSVLHEVGRYDGSNASR